MFGFSVFFLINIFFFAQQQYQQFTHINGNSEINVDSDLEKNIFGGHWGSTSFLVAFDIFVFFGFTYYGLSDQIWKFSVEENEWKFIKGREAYNQPAEFTTRNDFNESYHIGGRYDCKGWRNDKIITLFGGYHPFLSGHSKMNDVWRYDITNNSYSVLYYPEDDNDFYANYTIKGEFDAANHPGGRNSHEIVQIDDDEVLMFGGHGYIYDNQNYGQLGDWWIYSTEKMQWAYMGGNLTNGYEEMVYGETNVYDSANTIGVKEGMKGIKINDEEILIFGGYHYNNSHYNKNIIQKFNTSSYQWKYVRGTDNSVGQGFLRTYNETNIIGARRNHGMWKINKEEILVFGGYGYAQKLGTLHDEWVYNYKTDLWKFTGKESTKSTVNNVYNGTAFPDGIHRFVGQFLEEKKEIIVIGGANSIGHLGDVWKLYLGNIC